MDKTILPVGQMQPSVFMQLQIAFQSNLTRGNITAAPLLISVRHLSPGPTAAEAMAASYDTATNPYPERFGLDAHKTGQVLSGWRPVYE